MDELPAVPAFEFPEPQSMLLLVLFSSLWAIFAIPLCGTLMALVMSGERSFGRRYGLACLTLLVKHALVLLIQPLGPSGVMSMLVGSLAVLLMLLLVGEGIARSLLALLAPWLIVVPVMGVIVVGIVSLNFAGAA